MAGTMTNDDPKSLITPPTSQTPVPTPTQPPTFQQDAPQITPPKPVFPPPGPAYAYTLAVDDVDATFISVVDVATSAPACVFQFKLQAAERALLLGVDALAYTSDGAATAASGTWTFTVNPDSGEISLVGAAIENSSLLTVAVVPDDDNRVDVIVGPAPFAAKWTSRAHLLLTDNNA